MKIIVCLILLQVVCHNVNGQNAADYGFKHLVTAFKGDKVDILIKSKKGEEKTKKPLLLFCQGSLPIPLIITYEINKEKGIYSVFPFNPDSLCVDFHLAIVGKPYVPVIAKQEQLAKDLTIADSLGNFPRSYTARNTLDYYVERNLRVIEFLQQQPFIADSRLVIAGHSEGSTIAANLAFRNKKITELIYSGGSPLGRIMTIIGRKRQEQWADSTKSIQEIFTEWGSTVENNSVDDSPGDHPKGLFQFSYPAPIELLLTLKIPVLIAYGSKDFGAIFQNDYLRVITIARKLKNLKFREYKGLDHNFFPLLSNGQPDYNEFNWDNVAHDWRKWLSQIKKNE